ncbi:hypothetical protein ACFO25_18510 [Paenactinomyces guangxiensis]|uniref:PhiEco32-like amidoligase-type 2 protein n=1 Tax=Paenactinomyces guangxiensis TaxID=1490290 RepID=A0A7W1WQW7_9BACL|nr:hypothetical protein [Paenactinomyces guangxiensis]MBA4494438.1 hypothetical protein [Paenactinomyces guangxiensis]MBH8591507.1 hypothetical protein [Paenactinomyces guangxiensis]
MGAVTLPYIAIENKVRDAVVAKDRKLAPSIRLESPNDHRLAKAMLILNDEKKVEGAIASQTRNQTLQLHGISVSMDGSVLREYVVCVFQTRVLAMYRSISQSAWLAAARKQKKLTFQRVPVQDQRKEVRKVRMLSIRALYALGLDYGVVKIGIGAARKMVVLQVVPGPKLNQEMENALVRSITQYIKQLKEPRIPLDRIVLGADPEFVMQSPKGQLLIASKYFPVRGKVGCDAIWLGQSHSNKPLVEIRPEPSSDPRTLVIRIYQGLMQAAKRMRNTPGKWLAGAMPYNGFSLGGHIHFSGIHPNFKMLRALDNYLSLPLVAVEDERGKNRRPKYGFLGDFRYQYHGGFEYRTLPSWLISPTLTKGVLVAAKLIVANYPTLKHNPLAEFTMQQAYYAGNKEKIAGLVESMWEDLKKLEDYKIYQKYLDSFYRYITSGEAWDERQDLRKVWRIPPYHRRKQA